MTDVMIQEKLPGCGSKEPPPEVKGAALEAYGESNC